MVSALTTTYRNAQSRGRKRPLHHVVLAAGPLIAQRASAGVRVFAALVGVVALFLPWHVVRASDAGSWGALCWGPDCHPSPPSPPTYGPPITCTGFTHGSGAAKLALLVATGALSLLVILRRPRLAPAMLIVALEVATAIALFYAFFDLAHLFDHVETRVGEVLFGVAWIVLLSTAALELVATPLLHVWARARLPPMDR